MKRLLLLCMLLASGVAAAEGLPPYGSGQASTLKAWPAGRARCPFVVQDASGYNWASIDCTGKYGSSALSGTDAYKAVNGARWHFGQGASDYATSDGTIVTFAGPVAAPTLAISSAAGTNGIMLTNNARIKFGSGSNSFLYGDGSGVRSDGTLQGSIVSAGAGAGNDGLRILQNGARLHFGAGTSDYATSDGTIVTFAGPVKVNGLNVNGQVASNLANGSAATDAATVGQLRQYLQFGGFCAGHLLALTGKEICGTTLAPVALAGGASSLSFYVANPGTGAGTYTVSVEDLNTATQLGTSGPISCTGNPGSGASANIAFSAGAVSAGDVLAVEVSTGCTSNPDLQANAALAF